MKTIKIKKYSILLTKKYFAKIDKNITIDYHLKKIHSISNLIDQIKINEYNEEIKQEIINVLWNFGFGLLSLLYVEQKINLFQLKYKDILIFVLLISDSDHIFGSSSHIVDDIGTKLRHHEILKKTNYVCDYLKNI